MGIRRPPVLDWTTTATARRFLSSITQASVFGLRQYFARAAFRGSIKHAKAAARKLHVTAATGNATGQQLRSGGGGPHSGHSFSGGFDVPVLANTVKGDAGGCFAARPYLTMTIRSPLEASLLCEIYAAPAKTQTAQGSVSMAAASCFSSCAVSPSDTTDPGVDQIERQAVARTLAASKQCKGSQGRQPLMRLAHLGAQDQQQNGALQPRRSSKWQKFRGRRALLAYATLGSRKG